MRETKVAEVTSERVRVGEDGAVRCEHGPLSWDVWREREERVDEESPRAQAGRVGLPGAADAGEHGAEPGFDCEIRWVPESWAA